MRVTSCGMTDVGLKRSHNEDNYLINEELSLFVVADGMGGHAGGEYASAICVNTVEEVVTSMEFGAELPIESDDPVEVAREKLRYAIVLAGRRIFDKAGRSSEYHGMGTTVVVVHFEGGNAYVAHVGDSRVYLLREGRIAQVTEDHSLVNEKLKAGLITAEEAKNHKMRNVITRSLGYQEDVEVDVQVCAVRRADRFLLCSDGLSGHVDMDELREHMERYGPQEASRRLVDLACQRGGEDNITAVIARVDEV